jgi:hypothetical protein
MELPRNIFLFSDGHIAQEEVCFLLFFFNFFFYAVYVGLIMNNLTFLLILQLVLALVKENAEHSRIFSHAVGSSPNTHFLQLVSRSSGGYYEVFDKTRKSKWEGKVKRQIARAQQPALTGIHINWVQHDNEPQKPLQAPHEIVSLFHGSRQIIYGFVPNCSQASLEAALGRMVVSTLVCCNFSRFHKKTNQHLFWLS